MVDFNKRTTLKVISGTAAVVAAPAIALAGTNTGNCFLEDAQSKQEASDLIVPVNQSAELSIELAVGAESTIRLTNNSSRLLIVRHVYPGIIHAGVGKASFTAAALEENIKAFAEAVNKAKPSGAKGTYMKKAALSSTMGPGVKIDPAGLVAES